MESLVPAEQIDHFSSLPDHLLAHILSFLPTKVAAQTSVLSHRFQYLWETCPSLDLDLHAFQRTDLVEFCNLALRTLFERNPPSQLLCLRLSLDRFDGDHLPTYYIKSLVDEACILGLRHLSVELNSVHLLPLLPHIFSLQVLESLSLSYISLESPSIDFPITLTHLKRLHLSIVHIDGNMLTQLIGSLTVLEILDLMAFFILPNINLASMSIRKLTIYSSSSCNLGISIPSLEFLELSIRGPAHAQWSELPVLRSCSEWEVSALKKASIQLLDITKKNVHDIFQMLGAIAHVEKLYLHIQESLDQAYPFDTLGTTSVCPLFHYLRHVDLNICCHKHNISALKSLLEHSPALETLNLVHMPPLYRRGGKIGRLWRSKLPRNAEGNYKYAYFKDLHIHDNRREVISQLTKKLSSKRFKS